MLRRAIEVVVHTVLFAGLGLCNYTLVARWAAAQDDEVAPTCLGSRTATRRIVYLHGLDSRAPSWQELDNRRVLAAIPDAAIAIPRAPGCGAGRCWPDDDERATALVTAIRGAAETCFADPSTYGVLGFSRGGFALARLADCNRIGAQWAIVAGAFGYTTDARLQGCPHAIVIGRHDRHHYRGALDYAARRRASGRPTVLLEFDGGHRLDAQSLASAITELEGGAGGVRK